MHQGQRFLGSVSALGQLREPWKCLQLLFSFCCGFPPLPWASCRRRGSKAKVPFQFQAGCDPLWAWTLQEKLGTIPTTLPRASLPPAQSLNFSLSLSSWKEKNTQRTRAEGYCGSWLGSFQLCVYQLHPLMVSARTGHPQEGLAGWSGLQLFLPVSVCVCVCVYSRDG